MKSYIKIIFVFSTICILCSYPKVRAEEVSIESVIFYYSDFGQLWWEYNGVGGARSPGTIAPADGTPLNLKIEILHPSVDQQDVPVPEMDEKYIISTISGHISRPTSKKAIFSLIINTQIPFRVIFRHIVDHSFPNDKDNRLIFSYGPGTHNIEINGTITGWYKLE